MIRPWNVLQSVTTYEDQWIKVRSDNCRSANGHDIGLYHVIEYPHWVNMIALTENMQILLVRQYRHGAGKVLLEIPCGTMEPGDQFPIDAAKRELLEETGYVSDTVFSVGCTYVNPATQNNKVSTFLFADAERLAFPKPDANEEIEAVQEDFAKFLWRLSSGDLCLQSIHVGAVCWALMYILGQSDPRLIEMRRIVQSELNFA